MPRCPRGANSNISSEGRLADWINRTYSTICGVWQKTLKIRMSSSGSSSLLEKRLFAKWRVTNRPLLEMFQWKRLQWPNGKKPKKHRNFEIHSIAQSAQYGVTLFVIVCFWTILFNICLWIGTFKVHSGHFLLSGRPLAKGYNSPFVTLRSKGHFLNKIPTLHQDIDTISVLYSISNFRLGRRRERETKAEWINGSIVQLQRHQQSTRRVQTLWEFTIPLF